MLVFLTVSFVKYKCVSALSALVLFNFITYNFTQLINMWDNESVIIESIRIAFIMIACLYFGMRSLKPVPYLYYSVILFAFIFLNGLFLINPALAPHELYLTLTAIEVVFFLYGMRAVHRAKTKNDSDSILNVSDSDVCDSRCRGFKCDTDTV